MFLLIFFFFGEGMVGSRETLLQKPFISESTVTNTTVKETSFLFIVCNSMVLVLPCGFWLQLGPRTLAWLQMTAQITDIPMAFSSNMCHTHQHGPQSQDGLRTSSLLWATDQIQISTCHFILWEVHDCIKCILLIIIPPFLSNTFL